MSEQDKNNDQDATKGPQGVQGVQGIQGIQGIEGKTMGVEVRGIQGEPGERGERGRQGVRGRGVLPPKILLAFGIVVLIAFTTLGVFGLQVRKTQHLEEQVKETKQALVITCREMEALKASLLPGSEPRNCGELPR